MGSPQNPKTPDDVAVPLQNTLAGKEKVNRVVSSKNEREVLQKQLDEMRARVVEHLRMQGKNPSSYLRASSKIGSAKDIETQMGMLTRAYPWLNSGGKTKPTQQQAGPQAQQAQQAPAVQRAPAARPDPYMLNKSPQQQSKGLWGMMDNAGGVNSLSHPTTAANQPDPAATMQARMKAAGWNVNNVKHSGAGYTTQITDSQGNPRDIGVEPTGAMVMDQFKQQNGIDSLSAQSPTPQADLAMGVSPEMSPLGKAIMGSVPLHRTGQDLLDSNGARVTSGGYSQSPVAVASGQSAILARGQNVGNGMRVIAGKYGSGYATGVTPTGIQPAPSQQAAVGTTFKPNANTAALMDPYVGMALVGASTASARVNNATNVATNAQELTSSQKNKPSGGGAAGAAGTGVDALAVQAPKSPMPAAPGLASEAIGGATPTPEQRRKMRLDAALSKR